MAYSKPNTINYAAGGDTVLQGVTYCDLNIDDLYVAVNEVATANVYTETATKPSTAANEATIYATEVGGVTQLWIGGESSATAIPLTTGSSSCQRLSSSGAGLSGGFVGTSDTQELTAKTITGGVGSGGTWTNYALNACTGSGGTLTNYALNACTGSGGTLTTYTYASGTYNGSMTGTAVLDEDTLASDSDTQVATQQSIKAYVDGLAGDLSAAAAIAPGGAMTYWPGGASSAPLYFTSTMATVSGTSSATNSTIGWKATLTTASGSTGDFGWNLGSNGFVDADVFDLTGARGKNITIGALVNASEASRWCLKINDGVGTTKSSYHTGSGSYELLTVTHAMNAAASDFVAGVYCETGAASTAAVELLCPVFGSDLKRYARYISRNRVFLTSFQRATSGSYSITGCTFSPTSYILFGAIASNAGLGGAWLEGATSYQYSADVDGVFSTHSGGLSSSKFGIHSSFDTNGVTVAFEVNATCNWFAQLFEGNPI